MFREFESIKNQKLMLRTLETKTTTHHNVDCADPQPRQMISHKAEFVFQFVLCALQVLCIASVHCFTSPVCCTSPVCVASVACVASVVCVAVVCVLSVL